MFVNFNILNQLGSPAINSNTFANRPAAGQTGRLFVSTDTFEIYRDNGTTWDLIGGPGSSTITGNGTATQVAYFTSSQAIGSSANLYWDDANIRLGIGTATPGARLDIHGSNVMAQFNGTTSASNSYIAFQRTGSNVWRVGDNYNSGDNFFELRNSVLSNDALTIQATTNKAAFLAQQTYLGGQAQGALFTYNLTAPAGTTFATPNALSAVNAFLNLSLEGNATLPAGTRQGIEGNSRVSFTGAGTLTMSQGSTLRAYAAITGVHSFAGSAVGTITHLAGIRLCFPDNIGSAINITNNYGLLINDQSAGTGTITYSNRWGIYQEGASDLNYFAANLLIGSTVNNGAALQVTGNGYFSGNVGIGTSSPTQLLHIFSSTTSVNTRIESTATSGEASVSILGKNSSGTVRSGSFKYDNSDLLRIGTSSAIDFRFETNDAERMRITSSGNVGIGTTNPQSILDIRSANLPRLQLVKNGVLAWYLGDTQQDGTNLFSIGTDAGSSRILNINNSGNVGIGTISPGYKLDINGDLRVYNTIAGSSVLWVNSADTGSSTLNFGGTTTPNKGRIIYSDFSDLFLFYTNSTERMRIVSGGNVLIGTTTDAGYKLQVNGSGYFTGSSVGIQLNATSAGAGDIIFNNAGNQKWNLTSVISSYDMRLYNNGGINDFALTIKYATGEAEFYSSIKTGAPTTGTAASWKLGSRVAATVVVNTTEYIEVDIGGTLYKLATVS